MATAKVPKLDAWKPKGATVDCHRRPSPEFPPSGPSGAPALLLRVVGSSEPGEIVAIEQRGHGDGTRGSECSKRQHSGLGRRKRLFLVAHSRCRLRHMAGCHSPFNFAGRCRRPPSRKLHPHACLFHALHQPAGLSLVRGTDVRFLSSRRSWRRVPRCGQPHGSKTGTSPET